VTNRVDVAVITEHIADRGALIAPLQGGEINLAMRERTAFQPSGRAVRRRIRTSA
jgi:hypothetical protein